MTASRPAFAAGRNIAIKVPQHRYAATVEFYQDTLGLPDLGARGTSHVFEFGTLRLWIDRVPHQSQTDVWLEVRTPDPDAAAEWLATRGTATRDELEPLGDVPGHWISDPAGVVLLMTTPDDDSLVSSPA
jgi:hypothetical protein